MNSFKRLLMLASAVCIAGVTNAQARCTDAAPSGTAKSNCALNTGDLAETRLQDLRPTQPSLGFDELNYRLGRFQFGKDKVNKRFDDWCEASGFGSAISAAADARLADPTTFSCKLKAGTETKSSLGQMKTAVVGPQGQLFLTDGHHTLTSFMEAKDGGAAMKVRLRITHNFGDLDEAAFWSRMKEQQLVWLRDADDREITPAQLPASLGMKQFGNDKYRSIFYFGRDIGYKQSAENAAFQEFYLGRWLRNHPTIKIANYKVETLPGYLALLKDVTRALSELPDDAVVSDGMTAAKLGRLAPWNGGQPETAGEFAKQSTPFADAKPGKLGYAFKYKEANGQ